jgi:hypothetical protein
MTFWIGATVPYEENELMRDTNMFSPTYQSPRDSLVSIPDAGHKVGLSFLRLKTVRAQTVAHHPHRLTQRVHKWVGVIFCVYFQL